MTCLVWLLAFHQSEEMDRYRQALENLREKRLEVRNAFFHLVAAEEDVITETVVENRISSNVMTQREREETRVETNRRVKYMSSVLVNAFVMNWEDRISYKAIANYIHGHVIEVNMMHVRHLSTNSLQEFEVHSASLEELMSAKRLKTAVKYHIWALRMHDDCEADMAAF